MLRRGKNLRRVLQAGAGEPRIDHARVLHVVVGKDSAGDEKHGEDDAEDRQTDRRGKKSFLNANAQTSAPEGWTFIVSQDRALGKAEFPYVATSVLSREDAGSIRRLKTGPCFRSMEKN
jgi:hypothetical protein